MPRSKNGQEHDGQPMVIAKTNKNEHEQLCQQRCTVRLLHNTLFISKQLYNATNILAHQQRMGVISMKMNQGLEPSQDARDDSDAQTPPSEMQERRHRRHPSYPPFVPPTCNNSGLSSTASEGRPPKHPDSPICNEAFEHISDSLKRKIPPVVYTRNLDEYRNEKYPAEILSKIKESSTTSSTAAAEERLASLRNAYGTLAQLAFKEEKTTSSLGTEKAPSFAILGELNNDRSSLEYSISGDSEREAPAPATECVMCKIFDMLTLRFFRR